MERVSRTCVWAAMCRAFGAREPDARVRNPDSLAEPLIGPEERELLGTHPLIDAMSRPYAEASQDPEAMMGARTLIARTRFIDSRLAAAIHDGAAQVVILGAGFDTRAYRLTDLLAGVRVFEVDHPATQVRKRQRVQEVIGAVPSNLRFVAVDFLRDDLGTKLAAEGYRSNLRTFFIWEGVTMYLSAEAVSATLRWIAGSSAPGSSVVFDYAYETTIRVLTNPDAFPIPPQFKAALERMRRLTVDEPWLFGVPDAREEEFLAVFGLKLLRKMGMNSEEAVRDYLTREDGTIFGLYPAVERQGYLILEAGVG